MRLKTSLLYVIQFTVESFSSGLKMLDIIICGERHINVRVRLFVGSESGFHNQDMNSRLCCHTLLCALGVIVIVYFYCDVLLLLHKYVISAAGGLSIIIKQTFSVEWESFRAGSSGGINSQSHIRI